ncbi:MAG: hypothetical protein ACREOO_32115 [bacterium]
MTLGLVRKPDDFYAALEGLPDSLNFANLRLRARGLAYVHIINSVYFTRLKDRLFDFATVFKPEETPYRDAIMDSFTKARGESQTLIVDNILTLLESESADVLRFARDALSTIGGDRSIRRLAFQTQNKILTFFIANG